MVWPPDVVELPSLNSFSCESVGNFKFSFDEVFCESFLSFIDNFYSVVAATEFWVGVCACIWVVLVALDSAALLQLQNSKNQRDVFLYNHAPEGFHSILFRPLCCNYAPVSHIIR